MTLALPIKKYMLALCFLIGYVGVAQENDEIEKQSTELDETIAADETSTNRHHMVAIGTDFIYPITTGNTYVGRGMKGKSGFSFNVQLFVYKQFFLGGSLGNSYLTVTNPEIVGNYRKSRLQSEYLYVGYEFLPVQKVRLGVSIGVYGASQYKNKHYTDSSFGSDEAFQYDHGKINIYKMYIAYEINNVLSVYLDYSYRNDKMDIAAPQEIQSLFERAKYHNLGIGLRFYMSSHGIFDRVFD